VRKKEKKRIMYLHKLNKLSLNTVKLSCLLYYASETVVSSCFGFTQINARCPPKPLYHFPFSTGQGRGNMMKGSRQGQGEVTRQLLSQTKQTELGEKREFNLSPIKSE